MSAIQRELFAAARLGDVEGVRAALRNGASAREKNQVGMTALMMAARERMSDTVKELLPISDVNEMDKNGMTALTYSLRLFTPGAWDVQETLLKAPGIILDMGSATRTPLYFAVETKNAKAVDFLLSKGCKPRRDEASGLDFLMRAAQVGDVGMVKSFLQMDNPKNWDIQRMTALMYAASRGHEDIVELLVPVSDLEKKNVNGQTAKDLAEMLGFSGVIEIIERFEMARAEREELNNEAARIHSGRATKRL